MIEVTAEMIARGRGADPRSAAERRKIALKVREAREKLTSSGTGYRAFDIALLRLYAERRKGAALGLAWLGLAYSLIALRWTSLPVLFAWLCVSAASNVLAYRFAATFLGKAPAEVIVKRWRGIFVATETLQGVVFAAMMVFTFTPKDPSATTFILVALLLVAAMNATITASIPAAVYGCLTPMTLAILVILQPSDLTSGNALVALLALGTQAYFVALAGKLHTAAIEALTFQSEKDDLIAELEQNKANSDLARLRAEESNLAKSRFLATMSHELRTPLNAILGFSEVMKAELFGGHAVAAYKDYSSDIHASGEHLLMLINEILDLSRVEAGRYELREESVDLRVTLDECRHLVTLRAKKKDITIHQDWGDVLPRLWADQRAIRQVALNLLSNAIKFTPQGGQVHIRLGGTSAGGQFFSVTDTGNGIPEEEMPIVMSSFGRGTLAHKTAEEGTGLGLPIVKGLVELHGGAVTLKSKVREGTEARVEFPPERVMSVLARVDVEAGGDPLIVRSSRVLTPVRSAA